MIPCKSHSEIRRQTFAFFQICKLRLYARWNHGTFCCAGPLVLQHLDATWHHYPWTGRLKMNTLKIRSILCRWFFERSLSLGCGLTCLRLEGPSERFASSSGLHASDDHTCWSNDSTVVSAVIANISNLETWSVCTLYPLSIRSPLSSTWVRFCLGHSCFLIWYVQV